MNPSVFPKAVEIQTISACNAKCVLCPHPQVSQELPSGLMDTRLFRKIIDQIEPSWGCRIIPYLNNEPLLDPSILDHLRYINTRAGSSEVELSTNVSALTPHRQELMTGIRLTELRLSVFGFTEETHRLIMPGLKWVVVKQNLDQLVANTSLRRSIERISIVMINHPSVLKEDIDSARSYCQKNSLEFNFWGFLDRGGNVERYTNSIHRSMIIGCEQHRPLERLHITFRGDVIICCQDWRWHNTLGNVNDQSLLDIWNSDAYHHYRKRIYDGKGNQPAVCTKCKLSIPANQPNILSH